VTGQKSGSQFNQRPIFSRADEEQKPYEGDLPSEAQLDWMVPEDEGPGSEARAKLIGTDAIVPVYISRSVDNVSATPTDAEIEAAFGPQKTGFIGYIVDGGAAGKVWLCIKFSSYWHFVGMTRAT